MTSYTCTITKLLQKAIQENHTTQRRHMKSTNRLIKVQEDNDNGTDMATEVASEATARSQHIQQQETQKFTKKMDSHTSNSKVGRASLTEGAMKDPEADVQGKRSVHQLDTSVRLPWLKGLGSDVQPRINEDDEQTHRDSERLTSPDSGVMDHLSEVTESLDGIASSTHSVTSTPHFTSKSHNEMAEDSLLLPPPDLEGFRFGAPSHLQNGELPLRDYPILPPPKDYPSLEQQPVASSKWAGDAYTVQEAKLNSRPKQKLTKVEHREIHYS